VDLKIPAFHFMGLVPELALAALIVLGFVFELLRPKGSGYAIRAWGPLGCLAALVWVVLGPKPVEPGVLHDMLRDDGVFRLAAVPILLSLGLSLLTTSEEIEDSGFLSEYYILMLSAGLGMLLMAAANNLMIVFLGLELFSLALYLLCIFLPERPLCQESGMKYFILSSLASAVMLYGMALIYGATGTTWLPEIARLAGASTSPLLLLFGTGLLAAGLAFKISAVPLHLWTPDVYQGAPTSVTSFMSVATKTAAMAAIIRFYPLTLGMPTTLEDTAKLQWVVFFWALAVLSVLVGNLLALVQKDLKRMLAYSSVGHAGYLLFGPVTGSVAALEATCFYLLVYACMNVGAFTVIRALERDGHAVTTESVTGLASRRPLLAATLAVCLVSLAGLPPTGGFLAKFYLFSAVLRDGQPTLAAIGIVGSFLGAAYYLGTALRLFAPSVGEGQEFAPPLGVRAVVWICLAGVLATGLFAQPLLNWVGSQL